MQHSSISQGQPQNQPQSPSRSQTQSQNQAKGQKKQISPVVRKNQEILLEIQDLGADGNGIGHYQDFAIMVPGALPGETVRALVIKVTAHYAVGKLIKIERTSKDRTEPLCPVYSRCGGCSWMHLSYAAQLRYKRQEVVSALRRIGHFPEEELPDRSIHPVIGMKDSLHYRNKEQFPTAMVNGRAEAGLYAPRSHRLTPVENCLIADKRINELLGQIMAFVRLHQIPIYSETERTGLLRHIILRVFHQPEQSSVCLVINGHGLPHEKEWIAAARNWNVTSFAVNINTGNTNVILGRQTKVLYGSRQINALICGLTYAVSPASFFQVNTAQAEALYSKVLEAADPSQQDVVWDAYCGTGTISLLLARKAGRVYGVETVQEAVENARQNAALNHIENVEFFTGLSEEVIPQKMKEEHLSADIVTVDPPRSGCERPLLECLLEMKPRKIVYVSCDPATLSRDLNLLCHPEIGDRPYQILSVQPVDMFPNTGHVECVVLITRNM